MSRREVDLAIDWAAAEGWNPGWHDADCFHAADPNGFLLGLLGNEPIATISAVRYGASFWRTRSGTSMLLERGPTWIGVHPAQHQFHPRHELDHVDHRAGVAIPAEAGIHDSG
jgi:hypothetical protein